MERMKEKKKEKKLRKGQPFLNSSLFFVLFCFFSLSFSPFLNSSLSGKEMNKNRKKGSNTQDSKERIYKYILK